MKIKKVISAILVVTILFGYSVPLTERGVVIAQESPSSPSGPEQPSDPEQPTNPDQPEQPTNPEQPDEPNQPEEPESPQNDTQSQTTQTPDTSNDGSTDSSGSASENSGNQSVNGNTGDTTVSTGDATATGALLTDVNLNTATVPKGSSEGASIVNEGNNSGSVNVADVNQSSTTTTNQGNTAQINSYSNIGASTGGNAVANNMNGNVTIETGDANTALTLVNQANTNISGVNVVEFNVIDDHVGDIILDFSNPCAAGSGCTAGTPVYVGNTGNNIDTTNTASYTGEIANNTFQNNDAIVENNIILNSDTGNNLVTDSMNGDTAINSGDANVSANVANLVNNNFSGEVYYGVVNVFGDLIGDIILATTPTSSTPGTLVENSGNNSGSKNFANVDSTVANNYTQTNNLDLDTNINATATTGGNTASANMQGGQSIDTGDAGFTGQIFNIANNNVIGGDWWIVLVNEAGNWIGRIVGGTEGVNYAGSAGTDFIVNPDGSITAVNSGNNSGSTNTVTTSQTTTNNVTQTNNASITNNLTLGANTGGNTIANSMNGNASIETGDANIIASVVNFVNNNFIGGRVYMTVVNVLGGKWLGNFIAPGHTKEEGNIADNSGIGGAQEQQEETEGEELSPASTNGSSSKKTKRKTVVTYSSDNPSTAGVLTYKTTFTAKASGGSLVNPVLEDEEYDQAAAIASDVAASRRKIRVNLAWAFIIAPLLFVIPFAKRKLYAKLPAKKD